MYSAHFIYNTLQFLLNALAQDTRCENTVLKDHNDVRPSSKGVLEWRPVTHEDMQFVVQATKPGQRLYPEPGVTSSSRELYDRL